MNIIPRDSIFDFGRLFDQFGFPALQTEMDKEFFSPRVDITEHDDRYEVSAELAGVEKDNLSVHLEDGLLTIEASVNSEKTDEEEGRIIRKERRTGSYLRSFNVGRGVNESDINARFENGLLSLTIPKAGEVKKQRKTVDIL